MGNKYKARLAALGKRQIDLLAECRKRGYASLQPPLLSRYLSGAQTGPQATAVLAIADEVLEKWEMEQGEQK